MNLKSTLTTGGVSLAAASLACSGLVVGAQSASAEPAAQAAPASLSTTYVCSNDLIRNQEIATRFTANLPRRAQAGRTVQPVPFGVRFTVPEDLTAALNIIGVTEVSGDSTDGTVNVGRKTVKLSKVVIPPTAVPETGTFNLNGSGRSRAFEAGRPGRYAVSAPDAFTADLRDQDGETLTGGPLSCTIAEGAPAKIGTLRVVR